MEKLRHFQSFFGAGLRFYQFPPAGYREGNLSSARAFFLGGRVRGEDLQAGLVPLHFNKLGDGDLVERHGVLLE